MPILNFNQNGQVIIPLPMPIENGGTGAEDAATARANLGALGVSEKAIDAAMINGIARKLLTGVTAANQGGFVLIPHGVDVSKIIAISVLVEVSAGTFVHPGYTQNLNRQFNFDTTPTQISIVNIINNSGSILSKPIKIVLDYLP